jgi:hypothetical protein
MRRIYTRLYLLIFILISTFSNAQTVYNNCQDGKLYFKIKKGFEKNIIWKSDKIDINKTKFLNALNKTFAIKEAKMAFDLKNSDEELQRIYKLEFNNPSDIDQFVRALENIAFIEYAERVPLHKQKHTPNDPFYTTTTFGYNWNWHLDMINAEEAWDISTGNPDIKVAVVDGSIWSNHPDLSNKIVAQTYGGQSNTSSNPPSSVSQSSSLSAYEWSHGTHCAGLIAAETNNSTGIAAIGYNISLMAARAANDNGELLFTTEGVQWAANNGADVISMSYGGTYYSNSENTLMNTLKNNGIVLVAAAGNEGDEGNEVNYPAGYSAVISVAAVNNDLELASFSQHGDWIDIAAPGGFTPNNNGQINLLSTTYTEAYYLETVTLFDGTNYDGMQGTSMATPIVSGLCGLLLSINPDLTPEVVKACLMNNSQTIASSGNQINSSGGCIDAFAAAQCAQSSSTINAEFTANTTSIFEGESVIFEDLSSNGGTSITEWNWTFPGGEPNSYNGQTPPAITYNTAGSYNVSLTVNNGETNTETKNSYIQVSAPEYCSSSGNMTYSTAITLVNLNSINNATGKSNPYNDYTNFYTNVAQNGTYNLTVNVNTAGSYNVYTMVWIDWNQDYDFDDANEEYNLGTAYNTENGATSASPLSITVPSNAILGNTRMRVSAKYDSQATACEENYDGEVEDYIIKVQTEGTVTSCNNYNTAYSMSFEDNEDLSEWLFEDSNNDDSTWTIYNAPAFARTGNNVAAVKYHETNAADDWLFMPCGELNSELNYQLSFWYRVYASDFPEKMSVYIGNSQTSIGNQLITDLGSLTNEAYEQSVSQFSVATSGEYYIGFRTHSDANMAFLFIDDILVQKNNLSIDEKSKENNIKVFPNPSNGQFAIGINSNEKSEVYIYDLKGELVFNTTQSKKLETYDLTILSKSVYFIKIVNNKYTTTQKLIID